MKGFFTDGFERPSRLTLFSLLYAWANVLHQLSYPEWIKGLHPIGWVLFAASLALAVAPSSLRLFIAVLLLRLTYTVVWMPMIRGHLFLEGLFTAGILIGLAIELRKMGRLRRVGSFDIDAQERLFEAFAPILRLTCLLVYGAVTLAKLNSDFIDPQRSAAVQLLFWTAEEYPFIPTGYWGQQIAIWGTLAFEGGIPVLLCFKRTRWLGLVAGLFFHTLLALMPLRIASFTLTMVLLLFVWLPRESAGVIYDSFLSTARRCRLTPFRLALVASFVAWTTGLLFAARHGFNLDMRALDLGMTIWWWQTAIMTAALWLVRRLTPGHTIDMLRVRPLALQVFVGFVVFNVLCPYIGLKTRSALAMHSSLRTEQGYWNHLFLPEQMRVFRYQDQLVHIIDSDLHDFANLRDRGMPLPYFELRRWSRLATQDFYVEYRDAAGASHRFEKRDGRGSDPALMRRAWGLEWFLCFNPVGASHDYLPSLVQRVGPAGNIVPDYVVPPS